MRRPRHSLGPVASPDFQRPPLRSGWIVTEPVVCSPLRPSRILPMRDINSTLNLPSASAKGPLRGSAGVPAGREPQRDEPYAALGCDDRRAGSTPLRPTRALEPTRNHGTAEAWPQSCEYVRVPGTGSGFKLSDGRWGFQTQSWSKRVKRCCL